MANKPVNPRELVSRPFGPNHPPPRHPGVDPRTTHQPPVKGPRINPRTGGTRK